jgi:hypothetical protein
MMQDETLKAGLLMESVQTQHRLVEETLAGLRAHTRDLDAIVRDEIRRTLLEELQSLHVESERTVAALRCAARVGDARRGVRAFAFAAACAVAPALVLWSRIPSQAEIHELRIQRDAVADDLARLHSAGGQIEWRRCGELQRLCARVDRTAPTYGERADFLVLKGY